MDLYSNDFYMDDQFFNNAGLVSLFTVMAIFYFVMILASIYLFAGGVAGLSHMFRKAGEKPYKAVIPFYNKYVLFRVTWNRNFFWGYLASIVVYILCYAAFMIASLSELIYELFDGSGTMVYSGGYVLVIIGTIAGGIGTIVFEALLAVKTAKAYGKGGGYACGLFFLSSIFYMILGFGSAAYTGRVTAQKNITGMNGSAGSMYTHGDTGYTYPPQQPVRSGNDESNDVIKIQAPLAEAGRDTVVPDNPAGSEEDSKTDM